MNIVEAESYKVWQEKCGAVFQHRLRQSYYDRTMELAEGFCVTS